MIKPAPETQHEETAEKNSHASDPIGAGGEIVKSRRGLTLPVENVQNTVVWVNPAFPEKTLPFDIRKGKSTKLAVFFSTEAEGRRKLSIRPEGHEGRSGLLGEVVFRDKEGNLYRDIDAKGVGHFQKYMGLRGEAEYGAAPLKTEGGNSPWQVKGLVNSKYAHTDRHNSELLHKAGIRTYRVVAIVELEEIIVAGGKVSVKEARKEGIIPIDFVPVVEIRAYRGTSGRVDIAGYSGAQKQKEAAFEDAKALVAQELGKDPDEFSTHEYFTWFAETLGRQVAKLRKLGLHHGYLSAHNVTLDCQIVDLDSVAEVEQKISQDWKKGDETTAEEYYLDDLRTATATLFEFVSYAKHLLRKVEGGPEEVESRFPEGDYRDLLEESYEQELQSQESAK